MTTAEKIRLKALTKAKGVEMINQAESFFLVSITKEANVLKVTGFGSGASEYHCAVGQIKEAVLETFKQHGLRVELAEIKP